MVAQMDYPSTTQALFALIVMIIVLVFILVYCCWGTFACSKTQEFSIQGENEIRTTPLNSNSTRNNSNNNNIFRNNNSRDSSNHRALVILPYSNMLYIGDGETRRVYHFPMATSVREDKPPSYGDLFSVFPPNYDSQEMIASGGSNFEMPPTYEECLNLFKSSSNAEGIDKYFVASMEDLMSICTSISNCHARSGVSTIAPPSISASSEPVLSNISSDERSSNDLPLSRTKSNFFRCNLLTSRSHPFRSDVESQLNNNPAPISNTPQLSRTFANLPLTISANSSRTRMLPSYAASTTRLEAVTESQDFPSLSSQSCSVQLLPCLEESSCENLAQLETSSGDIPTTSTSSPKRSNSDISYTCEYS